MGYEIHIGDCARVMADLPAASAHLILTSPPYDNLRTYAAGCSWSFGCVAEQCHRLLTPGGVLVWIVGDQTKDGSETGTSFRQALHFKEIGLRLHDTMIYQKTCYKPLNHRRYEQAFEYMFVFAKGNPRVFHPLEIPCVSAGRVRDRSPGTKRCKKTDRMISFSRNDPTKPTKPRPNVWGYHPSDDSRYSDHPAVMPLGLATDHILSWTNPGDVVLDPFVGSGTTLDACIRTGRRGIGIEKAVEYEPLIRRRLADAHASLALQAS